VLAGLGGGLGSPLLGSMFSGLVPPTTSVSTPVSSPSVARTQSSPASSTTSHHTAPAADHRQYASPSSSAARRSKTSTPVQKMKSSESRLNSDASPSRRARRDSLSSTSSSVDHAPTAAAGLGVKLSQADCPSLESSLLSAEAAMYASSSLFFPFALPHLLGTIIFKEFVDRPYLVTGGLMFSLCFFFLFSTSSPKPESEPRPKLGRRTTLTWKELRPNFSVIR